MAIVSSVIAGQWVQPNGNLHVLEQHTDQDGVVYQSGFIVYSKGEDPETLLATHATQMAEQLAQNEIDDLLGAA